MIGWRRRVRGSESLIQECEAFLSGHLGEMTDRSGRRSSPSAWVNTLAHADIEELQRLAHAGDRAQGSGDPWAQAASFLAAEILWAGAHDRDSVHRIQVDFIVPIELKWSSHALMTSPPSEIVREVRRALEGCPLPPSDRREGMGELGL